jgi:M penetrans paralogue family 26
MENKKLQNATVTIVFGLLSIMTCWVLGILGLVFGIVALVISKKDLVLLKENPKLYSNASTLLIGRVLAGIGITISTLYLGFIVFVYTVIGIENVDAWQQNLMERAKYEQENK